MNNWAIRIAAKNGHFEVVKLLLEMRMAHPESFRGIDPAANDNYAIRKAAAKGHLEVVRVLLAMKVAHPELFKEIDPAANGNYAIMGASNNGHLEVVKVLLAMKESDTDNEFGYRNIDPAARNSAGSKLAAKEACRDPRQRQRQRQRVCRGAARIPQQPAKDQRARPDAEGGLYGPVRRQL